MSDLLSFVVSFLSIILHSEHLETSALGLFDFNSTLIGTALIILLGEFIYGKVVLSTKTSFSRNQNFVRTLMFTPYNQSLLALRSGWDEISKFVSSKLRYGYKAILVHASLANKASNLITRRSLNYQDFMAAAVELEIKNTRA